MTPCCQYTELKSSVYNQTGEGFFDQLKAYNHMTTHLRKVYQAKCIVDCKNPNYLANRKKRCRSLCRDKSLEKNLSQDVIDRLAFDTEHHPIDVLKMGCNFNNHCKMCSRNSKKSTCDSWYTGCHKNFNDYSLNQREHSRSRSISRTRICHTAPSFHSSRPDACIKKKCKEKNSKLFDNEVEISIVQSEKRGQSSHRSSPRSGKSRYNDEQSCSNYGSSFETSPETSRHTSPVQKYLNSHDSPENTPRIKRKFLDKKILIEETKYSKFLFDITEEIVQNKYYTDDELKNVFKKHIKKNSSLLDRNKMMYEIYQLKLSLNMNNADNEEEEEDEFIENFINSRKFGSKTPMKPPTPPKILDENRIIDKIKNQDDLIRAYSRSPHNGRNAVVLIDANPELIVTERDILVTLMEMNLEPQQAHNIYRKLQNKSKDTNVKNKESNIKKSASKSIQSHFTKCGGLKREDICSRDCKLLSNDSQESIGKKSVKLKKSDDACFNSQESLGRKSVKLKNSDEIQSKDLSIEKELNIVKERNSRYLNVDDFTSKKLPNESSKIKKKSFSDNTMIERNSEMKNLKNSENRLRSKSADERLQSIQEVSMENDTQIPSDDDDDDDYSSDEDIEEEESSLSEDDEESSISSEKPENPRQSKSNVSLSEAETSEADEEESIDEDLSHNDSS